MVSDTKFNGTSWRDLVVSTYAISEGATFINQLAEAAQISPLRGRLDFSGSDFSELVLDDVDFGNAILTDCDFSQASLKRTNFSACTLIRTRFQAADLQQAVFTGNFELIETDMSSANLEGACLSYTMWIGGSVVGANGTDVSARQADIETVAGAEDLGLITR